jgi:CRISPR type III-A/MTUBE-associated RAMP protein Csm4
MKAIILKCRPGSRFHFGRAAMRQNDTLSDTDEIIHSDVLFGAFISAVARLYPEVEVLKWKKHFEEGNIVFSSAFYCVEYQGKIVYLLPKPISLNHFPLKTFDSIEGAHKKLKRIKFISKGIWEKQLTPDDWFSNDDICFSPESRVVCLKEEFGNDNVAYRLSEKMDTPKVKVRNISKEDTYYTQTDLVLVHDENISVHWYFLWENTGLDEEEKKQAEKIITLMAESGLGGERSTGCGHIEEVVFDRSFAINTDKLSEQYVSLSLIIPSASEHQELIAYQTVQRGGMYYGANKRVKSVIATTEGAIIRSKINGSIANLSTEDRNHWRYGICFPIPLPDSFKLNECTL